MIYQYYCKCGKEKEVRKPLREIDGSVYCVCGKEMKRMIVNNGGFRLKGTGWYRDGY